MHEDQQIWLQGHKWYISIKEHLDIAFLKQRSPWRNKATKSRSVLYDLAGVLYGSGLELLKHRSRSSYGG